MRKACKVYLAISYIVSLIIWEKLRGYKLATKILKAQRKTVFSENMMTEKLENTPFAKQGSYNLIREGRRTIGSGRVATIIG